MAAQNTLILCLWLLWSCENTLAQDPEILTAPEAQPPVPFNLDDNVTYTCTVRGNSLIWQVNNAQLVTPMDIADAQSVGIFAEVTDNMDGTLAGTLQITVGEDNAVNMTQIGCHAVGALTVERVFSGFVSLVTFGIPEAPLNFQLTLSNAPGTLTIRWDPPTNTPPDVPTTHDVVVVNMATREPYPGFPQNNLVLDMTILSFNEQNTSCTPFDFEVTATNAAGTSNSSVLTETIPISPDVTPINEYLGAQNGISVSFSGNAVSITLTFQQATSCSPNFPVVEHTVNIETAESASPVDASSTDDVITVTLGPGPPIVSNSAYTISVTAATNITRRTSDSFRVFTTNVQTATVDYIETDNRVFLTCTFAVGSTAQGCVFIFTLRNDSERFSVTREAGALCTTSTNNAGSYDTIEVVDLESDGSEGTLSRIVEPVLDSDEGGFSRTCPLPDDGLSGGAIAGIVIGFVVLLILAVIFMLIGVRYFDKYRQHKRDEPPVTLNGSITTALDAMETDEGDETRPLKKMKIGRVDLSDLEDIKVTLIPHKVQRFKRQGASDMKNLLLHCEDCS